MNIRLGYRLLRDHRVPVRAKLMALGIGAACIGALELLQLQLEAVLAAILPLIGITGDVAFDGAEAVVGPVIPKRQCCYRISSRCLWFGKFVRKANGRAVCRRD